ncbi:hypothetical protein RJE46_10205 [Cedecea neteri]|uniref:Uncharacterized protein n=1 Tax=Cedecea neteri TaxID=158822 RepID=A0AAN0S6S3_9ENTR|nr:hypothetical protein [Cedecea neteri]AIR62536.1 hypothetical protein LH23_18300 [Cedecea neteri]WNJ81571.1 hypothetical protein RJE46_10205 [Cedecea neteri]
MILNNGIVINGEYSGWEIQIVDDTHGDTGGYYLILRNKDAQSFDYWFEKKDYLDNQLADFNVKWNS